MNCITWPFLYQGIIFRIHLLLLFLVVFLAFSGQMPSCQGGWLCYPARGVMLFIPLPSVKRRAKRQRRYGGRDRLFSGSRECWYAFIKRSFYVVLLRCGLWLLLWRVCGGVFPFVFCICPVLVWGFGGLGYRFLWLKRQPEWRFVHRVLADGHRALLLFWLVRGSTELLTTAMTAFPMGLLGLGCLRCGGSATGTMKAQVEVVGDESGDFRATLDGRFTLRVKGDCPFRVRLLYLFLRLLEVEGETRRSRRTRDGRTPFVRQQPLSQVFGICQPELSRFEGYWLDGDWANLLSLKTPLVLTHEVLHRIVDVFAAFPWWRVDQVYRYLREGGFLVSESQVRQAALQSGWSRLRDGLMGRFVIKAESFRPRDSWLVSSLLLQVQHLLDKLESGAEMTPEERVSISDLQTLAKEAGIEPMLPKKPLPWSMRLEPWLFGQPEEAQPADAVCCCYCGSTQVVRKSRKPRIKRYYDEAGNLQRVEVYRYYCRNPECDKGSFTHLPKGLLPYSRYKAPVRLFAVQIYVWGMSTYRRTGQSLGVTAATAYRWVSGFSEELLPVAALFGVVRCSGVVGVDEKYVLVPKNDKPAGKLRRWMYVYFAVDIYTYDLLHIAIFPHNDLQSAQAFLLALRAKGYHPRVVVTDLRRDYGKAIAPVFPRARHHECLFHALQHISKLFEDIYGNPEEGQGGVEPPPQRLKKDITRIFAAKSKRTAQKRLKQVMQKRGAYVAATPEAEAIFFFLQTHWLKLSNAIESRIIPKTNNAVELVIRRFDQHYQGFCGFERIETAQTFLSVFEKIYRTTPLSLDAQPRIRGKSPLELAGYDLNQMPRGQPAPGLIISPKGGQYVPNS